jgi:hypothetical protein
VSEIVRMKANDRGWRSLCPAHESDSRSLSIREGDGGRILLKCWVGCTTDKVCAALGLTLADLFSQTDPYATSWVPKTREDGKRPSTSP